LEAEEFRRINAVRRVLADLSPADALESLLKKLGKTKSNAEFLMSLNPDRM
jgi:transcription termination factor Rho